MSKKFPATLTAMLLGLGVGVMLMLNLPGQMSADSVSQLYDGRFGAYNSWHPPVMAWLLGLFDGVWPGTALFVVFEAGLLALAFALSLRPGMRLAGAAVLLAIFMTPQFLLFQGIVWKDVLFTDAFVLSFALLARAADEKRGRGICLALFFLSLSLAGLARQNGLLLLPVGAIAFGCATAGGSPKRALLRSLSALLLLVALVTSANLALARRGDHGEGLSGEIQLAQIYDLTGAMKQGYRLALLPRSDPALASALAASGIKAYSLQMQDTLEPFLPDSIAKGAVMAEWRRLLWRRPDLYLRERLPLFWQVLATPDIALCHPAYAGIEGDPAELKALGLVARIRPRDEALARYARAFIGTPILSHLAFAALAVALMGVYLRRRRPADIVMAAMLAGALIFAASFFFVSVACDYRYLLPLDMTAMFALFHFFAAPSRQ